MIGSARSGGVVVIGAINVDMVVTADELPGPGQTAVGSGPTRHGGGKGGNAAVAAARLDTPVRMIGAVGRDALAEFALAELREAGADISGVARLEDEPTGVALIVVDRRGENQIAVGAGANAGLTEGWVRSRVREALGAGCGCVLVSTEIPGAAVIGAVRAAAAAGVPCVLNTAPPIPAVLEVLDAGPVLTPNARELDQLARMLGEDRGEADQTAEPAGQAAALAARTGAPVVVTLGASGALVAHPGAAVEAVSPPRAEPVDTTGAGDTFNGALAARLAAGDTIGGAVRVAVVAASLSVAKRGARGGMPRAEELAAALGQPELVAS